MYKARAEVCQHASAAEGRLICPKPRRLAVSFCTPERKPVFYWQQTSKLLECDAGYEILQIFLNKDSCSEGRHSPPYCSPPKRVGNPIVNDVRFHHQISPPEVSITKAKPLNGSSFSPSPSIRIEGFDCTQYGMHDFSAVA